MEDFDKWFNANRKEMGVTKLSEKKFMKAAWNTAMEIKEQEFKRRTCRNCKYAVPEKSNKVVTELIEEGKLQDPGYLRCTNRWLAVHNKQITDNVFGCTEWEDVVDPYYKTQMAANDRFR
jgi:predicted nucleic-acid-binding Zn-ribbon protein